RRERASSSTVRTWRTRPPERRIPGRRTNSSATPAARSAGSGSTDGLRERTPDRLESQLGDRDLPHPVLLDFPCDRHRKLGRESDVARNLVGRDLAPAEIADLVFCRRPPVVQPDPGTDFLAILRVRDADHLNVRDHGVGMKKFFDLARVDVL